MTPDELERAMQFFVQKQAQFQEDLLRIDRKHEELQDIVREIGRRHGELQDAVITVTGAVGRVEEAQTELAERVSAFISFVERYISGEGRN